MVNIDSLSANHMHAEQLFLSQSLKKAQVVKDDETSRLQGHLTKSLTSAQEKDSSVGRLKIVNEGAMAAFKQFVSKMG